MSPKTTLTPETLAPILAALDDADEEFSARNPGPSDSRRPVHTVYGGAHLFKADTAAKLGQLACRAFEARLGDAAALARVTGMDAALAAKVHPRVAAKLGREAVEDFRIDFEDGYGVRPDDAEDADAERAAKETADGLRRGTLPPFLGVRIKPLTREYAVRAARTLDLYLTALLSATRGRLPGGFVVTLPKISFPEQVLALSDILERIERAFILGAHSIKVELMLETPSALLGLDGAAAPRLLAEEANGRCVSMHLGPYDLQASLAVDSAAAALDHPSCAWALRLAAVSLGGTGIALSDGPVSILPLGADAAAVEAAMLLHYRQVRRALSEGVGRGWDLHPAQFPTRYAAVYAHYLEGLDSARARLKRFQDALAKAVSSGTVFDDAATARGLTNFFAQGLACGALTPEEVNIR